VIVESDVGCGSGDGLSVSSTGETSLVPGLTNLSLSLVSLVMVAPPGSSGEIPGNPNGGERWLTPREPTPVAVYKHVRLFCAFKQERQDMIHLKFSRRLKIVQKTYLQYMKHL